MPLPDILATKALLASELLGARTHKFTDCGTVEDSSPAWPPTQDQVSHGGWYPRITLCVTHAGGSEDLLVAHSSFSAAVVACPTIQAGTSLRIHGAWQERGNFSALLQRVVGELCRSREISSAKLWLEADEGTLGTAPPPKLEASLALSLETQRASLKCLGPDWDGYGAEALPPYRVDSFIDELAIGLVGLSVPPPDIIPGADGSLQAEWRRRWVELFYGIDSDDKRHFYLKVFGQEPRTFSGEDAKGALIATLRSYFWSGDGGANGTGT